MIVDYMIINKCGFTVNISLAKLKGKEYLYTFIFLGDIKEKKSKKTEIQNKYNLY